jgi:pimeloyl-ACP methyl ester carboxylesterase
MLLFRLHILGFVAALAAATACDAQAASRAIAAHDGAAAKPLIVLVHGAFADASGWHAVIRILQAKGYEVSAVQNPNSS